MYVDAHDFRPSSALRPRPFGLSAAIGAVGWTVMIHVVLVVAATAVGLAFGKDAQETGAAVDERKEEAPIPINFIEAKLVKLGTKLDAHKLPNRRIQRRSSAPTPTPPPSQSTSGFRHQEELPDAGPRPPDPVEDELLHLGERAGALSRMALEQEGDPEGVEEGTATREEGDIYYGVLYSYFRRGWHVPTAIPDDDLRDLRCTIRVDITDDARVGDYSIMQGSGNELFDDSVRTRMGQAENAQLPPPPESQRAQYLGRSVVLRFLGRHAR